MATPRLDTVMYELSKSKEKIHEGEESFKGSAERIMIALVGREIAGQMFPKQGTTSKNQNRINKQMSNF